MKKIITDKKIKYLMSILLMAMLILVPSSVAFASDELWEYDTVPSERQKPLVYDMADLLSDSEESDLLEYYERISRTYECNVAVLTVDSYFGDIQAFTDDYFDYNGMGAEYGDSGILFMLSMDTREFCYCTDGKANYVFTDYGKEEMTEAMIDDLSSGNYYDALKIYGDIADNYLQMYESGVAYDAGVQPPRTGSDYMTGLLGSIVIGLILAIIPILVMKSQLNTVHMNASAQGYQSHGGINMTRHSDSYRTQRITKTPIPRDTGSRSGGSGGTTLHTSSSGHSHGGGHGHF